MFLFDILFGFFDEHLNNGMDCSEHIKQLLQYNIYIICENSLFFRPGYRFTKGLTQN